MSIIKACVGSSREQEQEWSHVQRLEPEPERRLVDICVKLVIALSLAIPVPLAKRSNMLAF